MPPHRRITLVALLALALAGATSNAQAAESTTTTRILTSPPRILASVASGASSTTTLLVVNQSSSSTKLTLRVADLQPDPDESSFGVVTDVGEAPRGAGAWLSIEQTAMTLRPGQRRSVPVRITVPDDADGGGWYGAIVVETAAGDADTPDVDVRVRLVTHVNVLVPGDVHYDGRFVDLRVQFVGDGRLRARALWENTGNVQSTPRNGSIRVSGPFGRADRATLEIPESMPGSRRRIEATIRAPFAAGRFRTRMAATLEDGQVVRSRNATLTAWRRWVPIAAGATLALLALAIAIPLVRRRRAFRRLVEAELAQLRSEHEDGDRSSVDEGPTTPL